MNKCLHDNIYIHLNLYQLTNNSLTNNKVNVLIRWRTHPSVENNMYLTLWFDIGLIYNFSWHLIQHAPLFPTIIWNLDHRNCNRASDHQPSNNVRCELWFCLGQRESIWLFPGACHPRGKHRSILSFDCWAHRSQRKRPTIFMWRHSAPRDDAVIQEWRTLCHGTSSLYAVLSRASGMYCNGDHRRSWWTEAIFIWVLLRWSMYGSGFPCSITRVSQSKCTFWPMQCTCTLSLCNLRICNMYKLMA